MRQFYFEAPKTQKVEDLTPVAVHQETVEAQAEEVAVKTEIQTQNQGIPVPGHVEPEPSKRGFLIRFFLPNG